MQSGSCKVNSKKQEGWFILTNQELENKVSELELRQRVAELEQRLANMQSRPLPYSSWVYAKTKKACEDYFHSVTQQAWQGNIILLCEQLGREAFKSARKIGHTCYRPNQYILTEEDGQEYFELVKTFVDVYVDYMTAHLG